MILARRRLARALELRIELQARRLAVVVGSCRELRVERTRGVSGCSDAVSATLLHRPPRTMTRTDQLDFLTKVRKLAGALPFSRDLVALYHCMLDTKTPVWAKTQIAGAIAYFVMPFDAIPDMMIPVPVGFADDAALVSACLAIVHAYVTPEHRRLANAFFDE